MTKENYIELEDLKSSENIKKPSNKLINFWKICIISIIICLLIILTPILLFTDYKNLNDGCTYEIISQENNSSKLIVHYNNTNCNDSLKFNDNNTLINALREFNCNNSVTGNFLGNFKCPLLYIDNNKIMLENRDLDIRLSTFISVMFGLPILAILLITIQCCLKDVFNSFRN